MSGGPGGAAPLPKRMQDPEDAPTVRMPGARYHLDEELTPAAKKVYAECCKHLHTGVLDWAVTDGDTRKVMAALRTLEYREVVAVVHELGETKEGASNLLAKLYSRGIESDELIAEWRKLVYDRFLAAAKDGMLPDLDAKFGEYQKAYVPERELDRGF